MPFSPNDPRPARSEVATYTQELVHRRYADPNGLLTGRPKRLGAFLDEARSQQTRLVVNNFCSAGVHTLNYFEKVANGVYVPPTPMNGRRSVYGYPVGEYQTDQGSVISFYTGARPMGNTGEMAATTSRHGYDTALPNRALIKCRLKLKEQSVNLAQAFAERAQTAKLLDDTIKKVYRCISNLRRGRFRAAVAALELPGSATRNLSRDKTIAGNWLALQYGWLPLFSDLYGSAEALRAADEYDPGRYRLFAKAGATSVVKFRPSFTGEATVRNYISSISGVCHRKAKVRLDYNLPPDRILTMSRSLGFTNPALLAWELTPFSFVADWFFPFGNYLSQLDATIGMTYLGGSLTERWECRATVRFLRLETQYSWEAYDVGAARTDSAWRRIPYASEPFPNRPSFKDPLSAAHVANAVALVSALRKITR